MLKYCIRYSNAGDGKTKTIKRESAHEAFIDAIEVLDNPSNYDLLLWIERP